MQTSTSRTRWLVIAIAAAFAAIGLGSPANAALAEPGAAANAAAPDSAPVGYRTADGAVGATPLPSARDGWDARFQESVTTIGYRLPDGHLRPRADITAIRDGWETALRTPASVIGYRSADGSVPDVSVPRVVPVADVGFHWSDAGAGAAVALAAMLLALVALAASRQRRRIAHT